MNKAFFSSIIVNANREDHSKCWQQEIFLKEIEKSLLSHFCFHFVYLHLSHCFACVHSLSLSTTIIALRLGMQWFVKDCFSLYESLRNLVAKVTGLCQQ